MTSKEVNFKYFLFKVMGCIDYADDIVFVTHANSKCNIFIEQLKCFYVTIITNHVLTALAAYWIVGNAIFSVISIFIH